MDTQEGTEQKKKRTTIADLKKDLQEVEQLIDENILDELAAHEVRLEKIETGSLSNREDVAADIAARLSALENATGALADAVREIAAGVADWGSRMEDAEDSIHSLQAALTAPQKSATHIEPAQLPRPIPEAGGRTDPDAIKAIAQVAQTMGDVLMLTRVLKADRNLSDDERREIMSIACKAAGVPYADNLLARAGVRSFEA